jgi:hypothetical protein
VADGLTALTLAAASLAAHLPFRTEMLFAWDSVLYVEALDDFNIGAHRPQPPGYLFYVLAARLIRYVAGVTPNDAYIWVSAFAAAGAVAVIYLAGVALFRRRVGLAAALLAATSVAFSAYAGVAYPYTTLALGSALLGWLCWRVRLGQSPAWSAGLALGLLSGFRQDLLLFLGPLVLVCVGVRPVGRLLGAAAAGAVGLLTWLVPSALLSGGVDPFLVALAAQTNRIERDTSVTAHGLAGLVDNLRSLLRYSVNALYLAVVPAAVWTVASLLTPAGRRDPRLWHLALWAGPAMLFYALIHIGDVGYVFSFMPAAWLAAAAGLDLLARRLTAGLSRSRQEPSAVTQYAIRSTQCTSRITHHASLAALAAIPIAFNLWWFHGSRQPLSAAWLGCRDRQLAEAVSHVQANYPPATTVLLTSGHYQQTRHYLPEYQIWFQDPYHSRVWRRAIPPGVERVVVFDWLLDATPHPARELTALSCGHALGSFAGAPGDVVVVRQARVELVR